MSKKVLSVGEYLLLELKKLGINRVYGIPGDMVIKFFKQLEDDPEVSLYTFSHEQGAGFAAVADARANRKPACAVVTYGPGILNALNAVACAYAEKTPLVTVVGGPPLSARKGDFFLHHTVKSCTSMLNAAAEVTAEFVVLDNSEDAAEKIARALEACQKRVLPVYIEVPVDVVTQPIRFPESSSPGSLDVAHVMEAAEAIAQQITKAQNPVLLVGVEADRYNLKPQILQLAEQANLPVASTVLARDHMPNAHPQYFGIYLGVAGNPAANQLVSKSDFVLVLGEMLSDVNLGAKLSVTKREQIAWCFDGAVTFGDQTFQDVPLTALVGELCKTPIEKKTTVLPEKAPLAVNRACKLTAQTLTMPEVIDAVNWLFGEFGEMPLIADTGGSLFSTLSIEATEVLAPFFYGTMGFAVPAAIGVSLATGKRPLVLVGDGGFQMTGTEICHCPRFSINPIFIVVNNRRWGMEQLFDPSAGFNELVDWNYSALANLWGGKGYRCTNCSQFYTAIKDAYAQKCFTVIEVVTERDELPPELMAWISEQKGEEKS